MTADRHDAHRTGGNTDVKANPPSAEGPDAKHNPDDTRRGNKAGQVTQEAGRTDRPQPQTGAGSPGWKT